jgi:C-terminal processing protease CtpA/Prc
VNANTELLKSIPNLIIDLRNNLGGSISTYRPLLPYIQSGNIIRNDSYLYCTDDVIANTKKRIEKRREMKDSIGVINLEKKFNKILANKNSVLFQPADTIKFTTTYEFPKNVSLLVNYGCMSATEVMILDLMQSKKVRIFGEPTQGAVDHLDSYYFDTPSGKYSIFMPTVIRIPKKGQHSLDKTGIIPDVLLNDKIDWIQYVKKYYKK